MKFFDYIFYRLAKFFFKRDGSYSPRAIAIVSVIQTLILGEIAFSVLRIYFPLEELAKYSKTSSKIGVGLGVFFLIMNYIRYWGKYSKYANQWRDNETSLQRKLRGYLVVLIIVIVFGNMIYMGTAAYR